MKPAMAMEFTPRRIYWRPRGMGPLPPGARSVMRPSRWGNPFRIPHAQRHDPAAHAAAVAWFRDVHLPGHLELVAAARHDLRGHDLTCACPPDLACHGDIWVRVANST